MTGLIVGIDPGLTGAIAHLELDGTLVDVVDMPAFDKAVSAPVTAQLLLAHGPIAVAWVERAQAFPRMGGSSAFNYGTGYGVVLGVLGALEVPLHHVPPSKWKRAAGLSNDKDASRRRAIEMWPAHAGLFARKKDDGRAEAALIARHGWLEQQRGAA